MALLRLDQLLEALKPDPEMFKPRPNKAGSEPNMMDPPKGKPSDALPPLAELKALRSLQVDVGKRTEEFDKAHPDRSKLTDEEKAELESLQKAQIDIAELVQELARAATVGEQP